MRKRIQDESNFTSPLGAWGGKERIPPLAPKGGQRAVFETIRKRIQDESNFTSLPFIPQGGRGLG